MTRLRYYKDDAVKFIIYGLYKNNKFMALDEFIDTTDHDTVKEAITELYNNKIYKEIKESKIEDIKIVILMKVDPYKQHTGDDTNILYYCKFAEFYFDTNLKLDNVYFSFKGIEGDFEEAKFDNKENVTTFGTGAMDAKEWFENECPNAKLADLLTKLYGAEWIKY